MKFPDLAWAAKEIVASPAWLRHGWKHGGFWLFMEVLLDRAHHVWAIVCDPWTPDLWQEYKNRDVG